jgi:hypothetical protein
MKTTSVEASMTFHQFCQTLVNLDDPVGDFADDFIRDRKAPQDVTSLDQLEGYLWSRRACSEAVEAGAEAWRRYEQRRMRT